MDRETLNVLEYTEDDSEMRGKYLTFWIDGQLFGVPIADVVQIIGIQEITPIPDTPAYARGVINLRGSIIPVIDVRVRFGRPELEYNAHTCIIVTRLDEAYIGFIVDVVDEVTDIGDDDITPPPRVSRDNTTPYLTGIGKAKGKVVLLVDTAKILSENDLKTVAANVSELETAAEAGEAEAGETGGPASPKDSGKA